MRQGTSTAQPQEVALIALVPFSSFRTFLATLGARKCCTHSVPLQIVRTAAAPRLVSCWTRQETCLARPRRSYLKSRLSLARAGIAVDQRETGRQTVCLLICNSRDSNQLNRKLFIKCTRDNCRKQASLTMSAVSRRFEHTAACTQRRAPFRSR